MDENPAAHPGVPEDTYHTLGVKTLWVFILERINAGAAFALIAFVVFSIRHEAFLKTTPAGDITRYVDLAAWILVALAVATIAGTIFVSWLIYINYKFYLGDNALKVKRGIFNKEEIAIPYRQIQDINIRRDLAFQMMGLSRVVIMTAGEEDSREPDNEADAIFPALDKDLAEWVQAELLRRANVQKVVETK